MANLTPKKIDLSQINGGVEYTVNDGIQPSTINGVVGASAYAQALATNTPDTTYADLVGVPSVEIKEKADGTPQLVFKNLKGNSGLANGTLFNSVGESTTDGYSQALINKLFSNPNLLINGDFRVNQRGSTTYSTTNQYTIDRWLLLYGSVTVNSDGSVTHTSAGTWQGLKHFIENPSILAGKTITLSAEGIGNKRIELNILRDGETQRESLGTDFDNSTTKTTLSVTITIPSNITDKDQLFVMLWTPYANTSVSWYWAKLEIGSIATPFSPRPYAEELAMCQRYYQKYKWQYRGANYLYVNNLLYFSVPFLSKMRTTATINATGSALIWINQSNGDFDAPTTFEYSSQADSTFVIKATDATATVGSFYPVEATLTITADAEIY